MDGWMDEFSMPAVWSMIRSAVGKTQHTTISTTHYAPSNQSSLFLLSSSAVVVSQEEGQLWYRRRCIAIRVCLNRSSHQINLRHLHCFSTFKEMYDFVQSKDEVEWGSNRLGSN
jgi:hypothetical protein